MEKSKTSAYPQSLTADYRPAEDPLSRLPVEVPTDSGRATDEDLRSLLHRRLRFLCLLLALLVCAALILTWAQGAPFARVTWFRGVSQGVFILLSLLAVLVWVRRRMSLTALRAIELVLVAILAVRLV